MIESHGVQVDLQITNQCPLCCDHCVYSSSMNEGYGLQRHVIERLCSEFEDLGVTQVSITGGEPFIRGDLIDIISAVCARHFEVCVQTSGVFVNTMDFGALQASGLHTLLVSIDGPAEYHDRFRHRAGTFSDAWRTAILAKSHGIAVRINTVVTRSNSGSVADLLPIAENDGVDVYSFFYFSPLGRGKRCANQALSFSEWRQFQETIWNWHASHGQSRMKIKLQAVTAAAEALPPSGQHCRIARRDNITILANGNVYPCVFVCHRQDLCLGNVLERSLAKIWQESDAWTGRYAPFFSNDARDCGGAVRNCSGGCPALRDLMRSSNGHCDRRCEWATTALVPSCAREYERLY